MDKRSTQLSLPLSIEGKKIKDIVKQHWNITFARQGKISVVAKRMMALVLAQIKDNDMALKPYYQMHASDVIEGSSGSAYQLCKKAFTDLASVIWMVEDLENKHFAPRNILDTTKTNKKDGFETAYNDGHITIAINPVLEPYFIGMAHFSKYEINSYMSLKSWYSMRLWEILSAFQDKGGWYAPLEEYRKLMDCENKYKDVTLMIKYTLAEPLEDLKGTGLEFTYKKVFSKYHGKGRPPVVGLQFELVNGAVKPAKTIPKEWFETTPEINQLLNDLINKWKISEANIARYGEAITPKGLFGIKRQFQEKEHSNKKINNKKKYCNAVLIRAGKEAMNR